MRLGLVVVVAVLMVGLLPPPVQADDETLNKVAAGLMVLNAFRGISDKELLEVGRQLDEGLVRQYGTSSSGLERAQRVVNRLESDPAKRPTVKVLNTGQVNAMAVPGHVYVTSALMSQANDDQLAGVIGHELAHIDAGHCRRAIQRARIAQGIGGALYLADANQSITAGVSLLALATIFDYSRGEEYEADRLGAQRAAQAGYAYDGLASFLGRSEGNSDRTTRLLSSHPRTDRRVAALRQQSGPASAGTVKSEVVPQFSVSFIGTNGDLLSQQFVLVAKQEGQPVAVSDWGGDYQVRLTGETRDLPLGVDVSTRGQGGYVNANVSDRVTWTLTADLRRGQDRLGAETASATGWRTSLNAGTFSSRNSVSLSSYSSWLGQTLQGHAVRSLAPIILHRLQEEERLRIANQPRDPATGAAAPERHQYLLMSVNNDMEPIQVVLTRALDHDSLIGIYRGDRQVGTLKAVVFNAIRTKVWVAGDVGVAKQKGVTFKSL